MTDPLVLGPLLRYVDDTSATVWVETAEAATVGVRAGDHTATAGTFAVHGHHYALVDLEGLPAGATLHYTVEVDGRRAWPPEHSTYPLPAIRTLAPERPLRIAFGSCRTSVTHDELGNATHGIDALRAYALRMAGTTEPVDDDPDLADSRWPDLLLLLGDQVYADETTAEMEAFIAARRDIEKPPGMELLDFEEYAHLYKLAWSDPTNRWLLSTLPTAMIFDDHDIRDDWNTSLDWKQAMEQTTWWHSRIVAGLASYWVYQHLGNLAPEERRGDPLWRRVIEHHAAGEPDLSEALDAFAAHADQEPTAYRWSYARDYDGPVRLVVVDSRAARVLEPERRALLDPEELEWLDQQMTGDLDHLLIGTSLPFMLARGLHHLEAFNEALVAGAWGKRGARLGERLRQSVDLEHWAAFQKTFQQVAEMVVEVAAGRRGRPPATVTFLSGDVHHSYISEARLPRGSHRPQLRSAILQAVCSPIRNPLSRRMRFVTAALSYGVAGPIGRLVSLSAKVPKPALTWRYAQPPWFDNNLAFLELDGPRVHLWWVTGTDAGGDEEHPRLRKVADYG